MRTNGYLLLTVNLKTGIVVLSIIYNLSMGLDHEENTGNKPSDEAIERFFRDLERGESEKQEHECFDLNLLHLYEYSREVRKHINECAKKCKMCSHDRYAWLAISEGTPESIIKNPEYQGRMERVWEKVCKTLKFQKDNNG